MNDKDYMRLAIAQARKSMEKGGFPAGAVLVMDGKVISRGMALGNVLFDPTSHPEVSCIRKACVKLGSTTLSGGVIYACLESCSMCFGAINWAGVSKGVYGCRKTEEMVKKNYYEGFNKIEELNKKNNREIELIFLLDFEEEILNLMKEWEKRVGIR